MYAFPSGHNPKTGTQESGMTLRDYFAAKAMQASLTNNVHLIGDEMYESLAKMSYKISDVMLKARDE